MQQTTEGRLGTSGEEIAQNHLHRGQHAESN